MSKRYRIRVRGRQREDLDLDLLAQALVMVADDLQAQAAEPTTEADIEPVPPAKAGDS